MIIIADSGSTKTNWALVTTDAKIRTCTTGGINPFFIDTKEIIQLLEHEMLCPEEPVDAIYFYGSGCALEKMPGMVEVLQNYFRTEVIEVQSDLMAAARSLCQRREGIICILGTGSNSCYYDGTTIVQHIPSLGYVLGDEGSGAILGRKLLANVLKNQLPEVIIRDFQNTYCLTQEEIMDNVYCQSFPNRFLAQFVPFLVKHIDTKSIRILVENSFIEFIQRNVLQYLAAKRLPIYFTGSVAFHLRPNLENVLTKFRLQMGLVVRDPLSGLINYHIGK